MYPLERTFVSCAEQSVNALGEPGANIKAELDLIKQSAKTVSARGIIAAVNVCEQVLAAKQAGRADETDLAHALGTVQRLVVQYARGLREIDPDFKPHNAQDKPKVVSHNQDVTIGENEFTHSVQGINIAAREENERSAALMASLMPVAPAANRSALAQLLRMSSSKRYAAESENLNADTLESAGKDAEPAAALLPRDDKVLLESLMSPMTNAVLSAAHRSEKSVSLSYAVGEHSVSARHAPILQEQITDLCCLLVTAAFRSPAKRQAAGLPRTGQISITAIEQGGELCLEICDNGLPLTSDHIAPFDYVHLADAKQGSRLILAAERKCEAVQAAQDQDKFESEAQDGNLMDDFDFDLTAPDDLEPSAGRILSEVSV